MPAEVRSKFWLFTFNNYDAAGFDYAGALLAIPNLTYLVYGHEIAPVTGTPHLQGYLEFSVRTKMSTLQGLKKKGLHIHWEVPKWYDTWEECRAYCVKDGDRVFEHGTGVYDKVTTKRNPNRGKRTDLDDIREAIASGSIRNTNDLENFVGLTYQGMLYGDRVLRNARPEHDYVPDVYWLYGKTGKGKSRFSNEFIAMLERGRKYKSWFSYDNKLKWFCGYSGQEIAFFDDFRGPDAHFPTLLRICDRYACRVEVKGQSAWWNPRIIIFTSPMSLEESFSFLGEGDRADQFYRRVRREGGGGEFNFNDPAEVMRFRERIDVYVTNVSVPGPASAVLPVNPSPLHVPNVPSPISNQSPAPNSFCASPVNGLGGDELVSTPAGFMDFDDLVNDSFVRGFNP